MLERRRLTVLALILAVVLSRPAGAQTPTPAAEPPAAIPIAEISRRAEEVSALVRSVDKDLQPNPRVERIEAELEPLSRRLEQRHERTRQSIDAGAEIRFLDNVADRWQSSRVTLSEWMSTLTARASRLEQARTTLAALTETWTLTRTQARAAHVPPAVFQRINDVLGALKEVRERVESQRGATLVLQDRVARELSRGDDALAQIDQARQRAVGNLFVRESPPIWKDRGLRLAEIPELIGPEIATQVAAFKRFGADNTGRIVVHATLILALILFLWRAKRRAGGMTDSETAAQSLAFLFDQPVAAGLVLGLILTFWIYPDDPRMARLIVKIGVLIPLVLVMRRLVAPQIRSALYLLSVFFAVDLLRDLTVPLPLLERTLFLVEMLAATVVLAWFIRSGHMRQTLSSSGTSFVGRMQSLVFGLALLGFAVAFVSGVLGNMSLARLIASGIFTSGYLALLLTAGRRLAQGLVAFALRVRPLTHLRTVQHNRPFLEWRATVILRTLATLGWMAGTLNYFGLMTPTVAIAGQLLGARLTVGALSVSLGDVLGFGVTLYVAFLVSSIVRFVLEGDVFPRLTLRPGLPYALSSLTRYAIIFVGFMAALAVLGLNLDRLTVLGGALGLGVGFGLQNIVNNFVSGLIVLFERPIRVGDVVQIGDVQGEVRRIGIRSSTVRTFEGADVIVPNSQLVADKVTNWTPFDQRRRVEIQVNVAYGSGPDEVLKVLGEVAKKHPDVLGEPTPIATFAGFGDSALQFRLWAWTARLDRFAAIRSEIGIAVYAALRDGGFSIPFPQAEVRLYQTPPGEAGPGGQKDQPTPTR